ncbi:hypothetical protein [Actinacidiphila glaucinigra]|nr:hypothetical protein [Actinacidiphila glaucinigra]
MTAAPPAPGNRAGAHVWRDSGMPQLWKGVAVLGDSAPTPA